MRVSIFLRSVVALCLATFTLAGCDKDPTAITPVVLTPTLAIPGDSVIARHCAARDELTVYLVRSVTQGTVIAPPGGVGSSHFRQQRKA